MGAIKPLEKNLRTCTQCHALYCINGDPSDMWSQISPQNESGYIYKVEGLCEFCRPTGKYSLKDFRKE